MAFAELGTTFIKLGQMLRSREDLAGSTLADDMIKLQADTSADPPRSGVHHPGIRGKPLEQLYADY